MSIDVTKFDKHEERNVVTVEASHNLESSNIHAISSGNFKHLESSPN